MNSVLSYAKRGHYGDRNWRGNTSGFVIKDLLNHYQPRLFVDCCEGSGTSRDVAAELQAEGKPLEYIGLDLHSGFNLLKDSLTERIGGVRCDYTFFHPPYLNIISYSGRGNMWGDEVHPDDLSCDMDYETFLAKMKIATENIFEATKSGGHYSILIGDVRRSGVYTSIQADLLQIAPGTLDGILIKQQFNCVSDRKQYSNFSSFIPIAHEYVLNFRKDVTVFGLLDTSANVSRKLQMLANANWRGTVGAALKILGGKARLSEIYNVIAEGAPAKLSQNQNWQAKVRAILQQYFTPVERGVWAF